MHSNHWVMTRHWSALFTASGKFAPSSINLGAMCWTRALHKNVSSSGNQLRSKIPRQFLPSKKKRKISVKLIPAQAAYTPALSPYKQLYYGHMGSHPNTAECTVIMLPWAPEITTDLVLNFFVVVYLNITKLAFFFSRLKKSKIPNQKPSLSCVWPTVK